MSRQQQIVLSVFIVLAFLVAITVYSAVQGSVEGSIAARQASDDAAAYGAAHAAASSEWFDFGALIVTIAALVLVWKRRRDGEGGDWRRRFGIMKWFVLAGVTVAATGCVGPAKLEVIEEIRPNETAFLVPLEGAAQAGQAKFMSVAFLEESKVATKRISIPTRKYVTGRGPGAYRWIPTMRVIRVDRTPVTREWTEAADTGTTSAKQAIRVESRESIDFYLGVTVTASITEADAAKFLYNFAGRQLDDIIDTNVRGFVQAALWNEFGTRTLSEGRAEKKAIMERTFAAARAHFAPLGITVSYLGGAEGLTYKDPKIQETINRAFEAENDRKIAAEQRQAQAIRNHTLVERAVAERKAAEEFAKAQQALVLQRRLDIEMTRAQAQMKAAEKWDGKMPANVVPQGSNFLFRLDDPGAPAARETANGPTTGQK